MESPNHVDFDIEAGPRLSTHSQQGRPLSPRTEKDTRADTPDSPGLRRRQTRVNTSKTFTTVDGTANRPNWHPGQEPGLDPSKPNGGRAQTPTFHEECQITVVEFSEDDIIVQDFENEQLIEYLKKPKESWVQCRWINVNGMSWDVVQALGSSKKLHRLALEDLVNTNNRTKADW